MQARDQFQKTVQVSEFIAKYLEPLARVVEGQSENGDHSKWEALVCDLSMLFPEENGDKLAQVLVTEACRAAFLRLKMEQAATNYVQGR